MNAPIASRRTAEILLVEDNESDVFLLREAIRHIALPVRLHIVDNGVECMAFLRKEGRYELAPTPDLILLDLNLPVMDGRKVLATLVDDPKLSALPVVVLTTSANKQDIAQMYRLRCNTYIVKPLDFDEFERVVRVIGEYWLTVASLPGN